MDISRLNDQGFVLQKLRNYWSDDKYNGINSQWIEPDSGQGSRYNSIRASASEPSNSHTSPTSGFGLRGPISLISSSR